MRPTTIDIRRALFRALYRAFTSRAVGLVGWLAALGCGVALAQDVLFPAVRLTQTIEGAFSEDDSGEGLGPQSLTLADVNDDDDLDLIAILQLDDQIGVALGNGDGTFDDMEVFDLLGTPSSVKVADVASPFSSDEQGGPDGFPDLIVGEFDGSGEVLVGDGEGGFDDEEPIDFEDILGDADEIVGVVVANFDGQSDLDIAFLDTNFDETRVFFACNNSNGSFVPCATGEVVVDGSIPVDIAAGNFDTVAGTDVVVLNQNEDDDDGTISILYGDGQGNFPDVRTRPAEADPSNLVQSLSVGNLNGDSLDDIAIGSADGGASDRSIVGAIMQSNREPNLVPATGPFADVVAVGIADLTNNGSSDVIISYVPVSGDSSLGPVVLNGSGAGTFSLSLEFIVNAEDMGPGRAIALGNLGGSTLPDIVQMAGDGQSISVALNEPGMGTPTATMPGGGGSPTPTPTGPAGPTNTPTVPAATATSTATPTPTRAPIAYGQCNLQVRGALAGVATGQLDGDASPDIAVTDPTNNKVYVIFNTAAVQEDIRDCAREMFTPAADPTPIVVPTTEVDVSGAPDAIAAVALDGDRDVDLVVATDGGIQTLINDGGAFSAGPLLVGPSNSQPVALAVDFPMDPSGSGARRRLDLNADGLTDVVAVNTGSTRLSMFLQRTDGGFTVHDTLDLFRAANSIAAADFTQDNNVDFVVGAGREALFLRRDGNDNGGFPAFVLSNFGRDDGGTIVAVTSGFFNGDQMPDVLVTRQEGVAQVYLFGGIAFTLAGQYATRPGQTAAGIGLFNAMDSNSDAVVASRLPVPALNFGLGDGAGMFRAAVDPLSMRAAPVALAVVNIDSEGTQDVVTANSDGTVSVLLSSVPPPTPTPLPTDTPPPSATPTVTPPPGDTPTSTPSASVTPMESPTRTATFTPVNTPKDGAFELSGGGCSIDDTGRRFPVEAVTLSLLLAGLRWSRRRAAALAANGRK